MILPAQVRVRGAYKMCDTCSAELKEEKMMGNDDHISATSDIGPPVAGPAMPRLRFLMPQRWGMSGNGKTKVLGLKFAERSQSEPSHAARITTAKSMKRRRHVRPPGSEPPFADRTVSRLSPAGRYRDRRQLAAQGVGRETTRGHNRVGSA